MTTGDPEIDAMTAVVAALDPLDPDARKRIIQWAADRNGITIGGTVATGGGSKDSGASRRKTGSRSAGEQVEADVIEVDEAEVMAAVAEHTGLTIEKLERLFHIDGGVIKILVNHNALGASVSEKARTTAQILTVIRKVGMGQPDTPFEVIRQECERKHYYDSKNFAYKHMANIDGFPVKGDGRGAKRLEARNGGINAFAGLVDKVLGDA